jgi:hypothetical protein
MFKKLSLAKENLPNVNFFALNCTVDYWSRPQNIE